jgi:hypothetical protein
MGVAHTRTQSVWGGGFMKYVIEMASGAIVYTPSFIQICLGIQKLIGGDTQTHREHGDSISLLLFFINKESRLKICTPGILYGGYSFF